MTKAERFKRLSPAAQKMYRRMQDGHSYNWEKYRNSPVMRELSNAGFVRKQMVPVVYKLEFLPRNAYVPNSRVRRTREAFLDPICDGCKTHAKIRDNLDGDDLCQACCVKWARGEGEFARGA